MGVLPSEMLQLFLQPNTTNLPNSNLLGNNLFPYIPVIKIILFNLNFFSDITFSK